ncbi:MAG: spondin domain-containing protein [Xanthomonadales bacterium]|nr:spondin domain-containing protein [Xanthomonadales bacterium]
MNISKILIASSLMFSTAAFASDYHYGKGHSKSRTFAVTITNITSSQVFTPVLVASHTNRVSFFELGAEPSGELADLAEGGATDGLQMKLDGLVRDVMDTNTSGITPNGDPLIDPGESVTIYITGSRKFNRLSLAGMLLPTNDTFVAIDSMPLTRYHSARTALAYDAGSEINDELCMNIPGPQCGGAPFSEGLAEGYVHISRGISGEGDLKASDYDWRNPVARVTVKLVD